MTRTRRRQSASRTSAGAASLAARVVGAITPALQFIRRKVGKDTLVFVTMLVIVLGLLGLVELIGEVKEGDTQAFDHMVMEFVGEHRGPEWLQEAARDITALGSWSVLGLATLAVVGFLLLRKQYHAVLLVVIAVAGGQLISSVFKDVVGRERPTVFEHGDTVSSLSFPSGHAMLSAVVYLTLAGLLVRLVKERRLKLYIIFVAAGLTFIVGASRIYIGVHWPTDVLAGWTTGLTWALICSLVAAHLQRKGVVEKETEAATA